MRRFSSSDLVTIKEWCGARKVDGPEADELGELGYVVEGVAVGFLMRTESRGIAFLDAFVTCPTAALRDRRAAIKALVERLCADARALGVTRLYGFTRHMGLVRICERLGFRTADRVVLGKEL